MISIFKKEDLTFDAENQTRDFQWSYYVTTWGMLDWTEGVPRNINWPFLQRTLRDLDPDEEDASNFYPQYTHEGLQIHIEPKNYHILWERSTEDRWYYGKKQRARATGGMSLLTEERKSKFEDRFIKNNNWMGGMSLDDVNGKREDFEKIKNPEALDATVDGTRPKTESEDQTMEGA
jgi:paired amphipathic helix protein Sin3a